MSPENRNRIPFLYPDISARRIQDLRLFIKKIGARIVKINGTPDVETRVDVIEATATYKKGVEFPIKIEVLPPDTGAHSSTAEHLAGSQGVAGSNPAGSTPLH